MTTTATPDVMLAPPGAASSRRLHGAALARIGFGLVWAVDASFKFLPGFVHGQTLEDELGSGATVRTPVIHQWIALWHSVGTSHPQVFAVGTGVLESLIAIGLILGLFCNAVFIGSAVFSFGIWSAAEAFHLPWTKSGITDLGPSVGYVFASLGLFFAAAGATWSLDARLRPVLGRFGWLASPSRSADGATRHGG